MRFKIIIIFVSFFVLLVGVAAYQYFYKNDKNSLSYEKVGLSDIEERVSATGSLVPLKRIDIEPKVQEVVDSVLVEVSDKVKKDDVLIRLNKKSYSIAVSEALANLNSTKKEVSLLETQLENSYDNLEKVKRTTKENVENAKDELENAEINLASKEQNLEDVENKAATEIAHAYESIRNTLNEEYLTCEEAVLFLKDLYNDYFSGTNQTDYVVKSKKETSEIKLEKVQLVIVSANTSENKTDTLNALSDLKDVLSYTKESLTYIRNEVSDNVSYRSMVSSTDKTKLDTQKNNLELALSELSSVRQTADLQEVTNSNNINTAQSELNNAGAKLDSASSYLSYAQSQREEKITQAESNIKQIQKELDLKKSKIDVGQANLADARKKLDDTIIKTPMDGIITQLEIEEGETAKPGKVILTLLPEKKFKIESDISEVDIGSLEKNDEVDVDFDAFPGKLFKGYISKIYPTETVKEGVIYYRIEVMLDNYPSELKSGLTANLEIVAGKKDNVLAIPYVAVRNDNNKNYIKVLTGNGSIEEREVTLGLQGETKVEIIEGLNKGEKVIIYEE